MELLLVWCDNCRGRCGGCLGIVWVVCVLYAETHGIMSVRVAVCTGRTS